MLFGIPLDIIVVAIVLLIIFGLMLFSGKSAGVSSIIALYFGLFLYKLLPYSSYIDKVAKTASQLVFLRFGIFLILSALAYFPIRKVVSVVYSWTPLVKIVEALTISILVSGLLIIAFSTVTKSTVLTNFIPSLNKLLSIPNAEFWWIIVTLVSFFVLIRR